MRVKTWPALTALHTVIFDFDGVFTDNKVYLREDGVELVRCDRADGLGIDLLQRVRAQRGFDLEVLIVSTEQNPVVSARARKLGVECHQGVGDKVAFVAAYLARRRSDAPDPFVGLLYAGNDLNDLPLILRAGFSVVPQDAHPVVRRAAAAVLPYRGGDGFVRALVERLLGIDTLPAAEIARWFERGDA